MGAEDGPAAEYGRRLAARGEVARRLERLDRTLGHARLGLFAAVLVVAGLAVGPGWLGPAWVAVPALLFLGLAVYHERVAQRLRRAERAVRFYREGVARLEGRWAGAGTTGERFLDPYHPYAADLDLFGRGSLFELLCRAQTSPGEACLAAWLVAPAAPAVVVSRQTAVTDLRPRLDLREDLAGLGEAVREGVDLAGLGEWGAAPRVLPGGSLRLVAALLAGAALAALAGWWLGLGPWSFAALVLAGQVFEGSLRGRADRALRSVERRGRELALLAHLLARLECEAFTAPRLRELAAALQTDGRPPAAQVARLQRLIELLDARRNQLFMPLAAVLLWSTQFAFAIEAWRARSGPALGAWIAALAELEALTSLAAYAYEHPADPFPELSGEGPCFAAEGIGHPLLREATSVRNDVALGPARRLLIVSGSNMSGKSTFLRTVGTNAVLALAGAPVRARRLRLGPLAVGASIRIQDSLQEGASRFYAEIKRLRQIVDLAGTRPPALFLLDEIMHGTNSHDRRVGAEAVARALIGRGGIGLITTHDLALAQLADDPSLHAANVHFEDHLEDGKIAFDYRLRPGVVEKSNALALMRAVGLEV
jgi:hypothetical protein